MAASQSRNYKTLYFLTMLQVLPETTDEMLAVRG